MEFSEYPDGRKREFVAAYKGDLYFRIGETAVDPSCKKSATVTHIDELGGGAGNLRVTFSNGTQLHMSGAIEIWEPVAKA